MASNFGIAVDKKSDGFGLKLEGDFDATKDKQTVNVPVWAGVGAMRFDRLDSDSYGGSRGVAVFGRACQEILNSPKSTNKGNAL